MIERFVTSGGIRIIIEPRPWSQVVCARIAIGAGSRDDPPDRAGLSHMLEHMLTRRKTRLIETEFESGGGTFNGGVSRDYSMFEMAMPAAQWETGLSNLLEPLTTPGWDEQTLDTEREVVCRELLRDTDTVKIVWECFYGALWPGHRLGRPIGGTTDTLQAIGLSDLDQHHRRLYRTGNACVAISGAVDPHRVSDIIDRGTSGLTIDSSAPDEIEPPHRQNRPVEVLLPRRIAASRIIVGFAAPSMLSPWRHAARLLNIILGQTSSSRLYGRLRRSGLAYSANSVWLGLRDSGLWAASCAVDPGRVDEAIGAIREEIRGLRVCEHELQRAKTYYRGSLAVRFEGSLACARIMAIEELLAGGFTPFDQASELIDEVTTAQIEELAAMMLSPAAEVVVICGPGRRQAE